MSRLTTLIALILIHGTPLAGETVSVPWEEFKMLYSESIERKVKEQIAQPPAPKEPQVYTITEAQYRLDIGTGSAQGEVLLSGKILSGETEPIPLFGKELIISSAQQVLGGSLVSSTTGDETIQFLPDGQEKTFQVGLRFLMRPGEDNRSRFIAFSIPPAIRNSLRLTIPPQARLLEAPGIVDEQGVHHFSLNPTLSVRYLDREELTAAAPIEIDTVTRLHLQGERLGITTSLLPVQPVAGPFILQVPENAQYLSSSLKASWISKKSGQSYEITIPREESQLFTVQFALEETEDAGFDLRLPTIQGNNGREGDFIADEPDDGQLNLTAEGLVSRIPVARLADGLRPTAGSDATYAHVPAGETIKLEVTRFIVVGSPTVVLDSQYFFTSFEENGSVMSVLVMDIPADLGPRIRIRAVPDARVWSLTVNGRGRKVYTSEEDAWMIPLDEGATSHVELALLSTGEKLGLHGRLETVLPETGLAARTVYLGIALPERVQLLSMEGPVSPTLGETWKTPSDFVGKPYYFSRSFYKGEGMKLAVSYKEPVHP